MNDYTLSNSWKSSRATMMQDLTFSRPDDIFIFTRFSAAAPHNFEGKQILFAEDLKEAAGYIRYIFLFDILNDMTDDMAFDKATICDEKNLDCMAVLYYAHLLEKIMKDEKFEELFNNFQKDFNEKFSKRQENEYEFCILKGADNLRNFLNQRFKNHPNFDKTKLSNLCSSDLFAGKPLMDYIDTLFRLMKE